MRPWRFIVLDAELKDKFAFTAAAAKRSGKPMSDEQFTAEREKNHALAFDHRHRLHRASGPDEDPRNRTNRFAAAAAAENLFLAAHDLGYGVMWKTGAAAYDPEVKVTLGLDAGDHIVGVMHLGTRLK